MGVEVVVDNLTGGVRVVDDTVIGSFAEVVGEKRDEPACGPAVFFGRYARLWGSIRPSVARVPLQAFAMRLRRCSGIPDSDCPIRTS